MRVRQNLPFDLVAALGVGASGALVGSLLPTIARRGGADPIALAALAAAPFVANLLGAFAGRWGPRTPAQLAVVRGLGTIALVAVALLPVPAIMAVVTAAFWLSIAFGSPLHLLLWGAMYPPRLRGRVVGAIGTSRAAAAAIAVVVGGVAADSVGSAPVMAAAGILSTVSALAYAGFRAPRASEPPSFTARESIHALIDRPFLRRMVIAQGFYGGGLIAATPLFALVHVDRLGLSLAAVGFIGLLSAGATTLAFVALGGVVDRTSGVVALRIGSALGLGSLVAYAFAPSVEVLWVAAVLGGIASAGIDVGIAAVLSEDTPLADRGPAMAGWNAITGIRGVFAPFVMSALVGAGVMSLTGGLVVCAVVTLVGVGLYVARPPERRPAAVPAPSAGAAPNQPLAGRPIPLTGGVARR